MAYEDENILICNKPVGLLCHSDEAGEQNTLIEQIKAYLWQKGEYDPDGERSFSPALCNRIDRNTEGLVIAAKTAEALRELCDQIRNRDIKKFYLCRVRGIPRERKRRWRAISSKTAMKISSASIRKSRPQSSATQRKS